MLPEYIQIYEEQAKKISGWKKLSISDICFKYIENKSDENLSNSYISIILYRYLKKAYYEYNAQTIKVLSEEDFYDLILDVLHYVMEKKIWLDENSKLFGNKDAPEIAINMALKTAKINLYIYKQRDRRKLNQNILSLQELEEKSADGFFIPYNDKDISLRLYIENLVNKYFKKKEYEKAFILDSIVSNNVFIRKSDGYNFSLGKVRSSLHKLDNISCDIFSKEYNIDLIEVLKSKNYVVKVNDKKIDKITKNLLNELKQDKELLVLLRNVN